VQPEARRSNGSADGVNEVNSPMKEPIGGVRSEVFHVDSATVSRALDKNTLLYSAEGPGEFNFMACLSPEIMNLLKPTF
jgi:hypothetical protein